jgi:hypothetical protein
LSVTTGTAPVPFCLASYFPSLPPPPPQVSRSCQNIIRVSPLLHILAGKCGENILFSLPSNRNLKGKSHEILFDLKSIIFTHSQTPINRTALLIWAWSVSNIKIHTGHTYLFLENKYLIKGIKKMFPHKILTFHSWENIYCKFTCQIEIWIT